jgi:hypothetical protein
MLGKRIIIITISGLFLAVVLFIFFNGINRYPERSIDSGVEKTKLPTQKPSLTATNTSTPKPTPTIDPFEGLEKEEFYITFYGWPDNTPSGNGIAFPKSQFDNSLHEHAGGSGEYTDPITFASDPDRISVGKIYYVPYLQKYIVMEDVCTGCIRNWEDGKPHLDIWMESDNANTESLIACQGKLTRRSTTVIIDPPGNLPVSKLPLFDKINAECMY